MNNLKTALALLSPDQKQELSYSFESGDPNYVILPEGRFIGVNVTGNPNLIIVETKGAWSYGAVKG